MAAVIILLSMLTGYLSSLAVFMVLSLPVHISLASKSWISLQVTTISLGIAQACAVIWVSRGVAGYCGHAMPWWMFFLPLFFMFLSTCRHFLNSPTQWDSNQSVFAGYNFAGLTWHIDATEQLSRLIALSGLMVYLAV